MELGLAGKSVWVVGATGGLGGEIAAAFAREGARVAISGRNADKLAAVAEAVRRAGGDPFELAFDATGEAAARDAAARVRERSGRLDVLVNSITAPVFGPVEEISEDRWHLAIDTKYFGYVNCIRAVLPMMVAQGDGRIVNITGAAGKAPSPTHMPGGSMNAALDHLTKALGREYAARGVRVVAVSPGPIASPRVRDMNRGGGDPAARVPMGRVGEPSEVADAVLFLASDRASFITATTLYIDGGSVPAL